LINIVTIHWQTAKWVDVQQRYLERNVGAPFRVYASLNGIDDSEVWRRFHWAADLPGTHYEKLNVLGRTVIEDSDPQDVLVFLDGDAFPVRPLAGWIEEVLSCHPLAAVRRDENSGDREPHASFCVTTNEYWNELGGDWDNYGRVLLRQLNDAGADWLPLLRTNSRDLHPLWFGVYAHRIYHHGAGFRDRVSKADESRVPGLARTRASVAPGVGDLVSAVRSKPSRALKLRPEHLKMAGRGVVQSVRTMKRRHYARRAEPLSDQMFARLSSDLEFYRDLDDDPE